MNQVAEIKKWFELAVPEPTDKNKCMQIGCHFEEVSEMCTASGDVFDARGIMEYADLWKSHGAASDISCIDEKELLDSLCDQIVTAIGVAHMFEFDIEGALKEVNRSNFSKFVDGKPVFNEQGKIAKGANYTPPDLTPYLGNK